MKIRESDLPEEKECIRFFNPIGILKLLGVSKSTSNVADFGYILGFALQNGIFSFIGFLLVGVGLRLMFKSKKAET